jgi:hypothetical protein
LKVLDVPLHFCHEDDLRLLVTEITRLRKENAELEQIKRENEELRAAFGQMSEDRLHEKASRQDKLKKAILEMRDGDDRTLLTMTFKEWVVLAREAKAAAELDKKEKAIKDLTDKREALKIQADEKQDRVKNKALMAFGSQFQKGGLRVTFHAWKTLTIAESSRRQMHGGISLAFARNSSKALKDLCFSAWKQLAYEEKLQKKAHEKMMATSAEQANLRMRLIAKTTAYWAKDAAVFHRAVLGAWHRYARERREHRARAKFFRTGGRMAARWMADVDEPAFLRLVIEEWHAAVLELKKEKEEEKFEDVLLLEDAANKQSTLKRMNSQGKALLALAGSETLLRLILHTWHTCVVTERVVAEARQKFTAKLGAWVVSTSDEALLQLSFSAWKDETREQRLEKQRHEKFLDAKSGKFLDAKSGDRAKRLEKAAEALAARNGKTYLRLLFTNWEGAKDLPADLTCRQRYLPTCCQSSESKLDIEDYKRHLRSKSEKASKSKPMAQKEEKSRLCVVQ